MFGLPLAVIEAFFRDKVLTHPFVTLMARVALELP
jgi:hypothetical protein